MVYIILGLFVLVIFFAVALYAFRTALNSSSIAQDLREIRIILMKAQSEDFGKRS